MHAQVEVAHDRLDRRSLGRRCVSSATSLPERSPASSAELHVAHPLAPRLALAPQLLQPLDAAFVAGAARLDALADPDFFLRPELVELAVARRLRRPVAPPCAARTRRNCPGYERSRPRSSSTMRVATRSRNARSCVMTIDRRAARDEQVLEQLDAVDVEVVGRFVEQQQVGLERKGASASAARLRSPPDRPAVGRACLVQSEAMQVLDEPRVDTPAHHARRRSRPARPQSARDSRSVGAAGSSGSCSIETTRSSVRTAAARRRRVRSGPRSLSAATTCRCRCGRSARCVRPVRD